MAERKRLGGGVAIALAFCAVMLCVIWGHSLLSISDSSQESSRLLSFILSALHIDVSAARFAALEHIMRKCAHFTEFACLGAFSSAVAYFICGRDVGRTLSALPLPALCCLCVASTDETIQIFSGRGNAVSDVFLDFSGALTAMLIFACVLLIRRRKRRDGESLTGDETQNTDDDA